MRCRVGGRGDAQRTRRRRRSVSPWRSSSSASRSHGSRLPLIVDEGYRVEPVGEAGERAAGVDLRKLAGVADEHDLRLSVVQHGRERVAACGCRPCRLRRSRALNRTRARDRGRVRARRRSIVFDGMPDPSSSRAAAPRRKACSDDFVARRSPGFVRGRRGRTSCPAPATPITTSTPFPDRHTRRTIAACSRREVRARRGCGFDVARARDPGTLTDPVERRRDQGTFDLDHLRRRPPTRVGASGRHVPSLRCNATPTPVSEMTLVGSEELIGEVKNLLDRRPSGQGVTHGLDHVLARECGPPFGESPPGSRAGSTATRPRCCPPPAGRRCGATEHRVERSGVETECRGPCPPLLDEHPGIECLVLGMPGSRTRRTGRPSRWSGHAR